jgi:hypothetical protein
VIARLVRSCRPTLTITTGLPSAPARERGGKALGLPDRLDEPAYDGGVRILEEVFEERRRAHQRE